MSSESEQAAMQAASDGYVATHRRTLLSESEECTSVTVDYIVIASFGGRNACMQTLANMNLEQCFLPMTVSYHCLKKSHIYGKRSGNLGQRSTCLRDTQRYCIWW